MKRVWTSLLCLVMCLMLLMPAGFAAEAEAESTGELNFTVLHTGDINGKEAYDDSAIGFAKVATYAVLCAQQQPTLLVDSGNALGGDGGKTISLMENAQYTAGAIGTRDVALGIDRLTELKARANFPLLCANWLKMDGDLLWDPYTVVEVGDKRVGIIGLISPDIKEMYPEETQLCNVYDPGAIADIYYEQMLEQGCTYFIALTSLGYDSSYTPRDLGTECPWINLILDSNTTEETALDLGELISADSGVIIFNLLPDFAQFGQIDIVTGTADGMNTTLPEVYNSADMAGVPDDAYVAQLVEEEWVEPGTVGFDEEEEPSDGKHDVQVSEEGKSLAIYLVCFGAIIAITAGIIVYIAKKPAKKSGKK